LQPYAFVLLGKKLREEFAGNDVVDAGRAIYRLEKSLPEIVVRLLQSTVVGTDVLEHLRLSEYSRLSGALPALYPQVHEFLDARFHTVG